MMKFIRGLYVGICYVIGFPVFVAFSVVVVTKTIIRDVINGYGFDWQYVKDYAGAFWHGAKRGHRFNMHFIKRGNTPIENYDELLKGL